MGIQGGINIKTQINAALKTLREQHSKYVSCDTEVNNERKIVKATLFINGASAKRIISTGYGGFADRTNISKGAEDAIIDAIKNFDTTLIK